MPTLLEHGEREFAVRTVRWLTKIQLPNGSYSGLGRNGPPSIFDTALVLRGMLAAIDIVPEAYPSAMRAVDYLYSQMRDGGNRGFESRYGPSIPESINLYALPPLAQAAQDLNKPECRLAVSRCVEYYLNQNYSLQPGTLTHYLGYELEAVIDLNHAHIAMPVLDFLRAQQLSGGSVRSKGEGAGNLVCAPGLAQLALCWYKVGHWEAADRAMDWLDHHQTSSGGWFRNYGDGATYVLGSELASAAKFYLDANRHRVSFFMDRIVEVLPSEVALEDGRAQAILSIVRLGDRVVEVGCGSGRFLKLLQQVYPDIDCTGVDISPAMLAMAPSDIRRLRGSLESVPCPDNSFDVVFTVDAVEHSSNLVATAAELIRIARPGGWVVVIDKQGSFQSRAELEGWYILPNWEQWPDAQRLMSLLAAGCEEVTCISISSGEQPVDASGMVAMWSGRKRIPPHLLARESALVAERDDLLSKLNVCYGSKAWRLSLGYWRIRNLIVERLSQLIHRRR